MRISKLVHPSAVIFIWLFVTGLSVCAQTTQPVISSPVHQQALNEFKKRADEYRARNLNRFALFELQRYDRVLDSMAANEKADTLAAIQKNYVEKVDKRKAETGDVKTRLGELSKKKETASENYHGLLRKAGIAFVVWLIVILILLSWRRRLVKKSQLELDNNQAQLKSSEQFYHDGQELFRFSSELQRKITGMSPVAAEIQKSTATLSKKLSPELFKSDSFRILQKNSETIQNSTTRFNNLTNAIVSQHDDQTLDKKVTDINTLCEHYSDLAYTGMLNEEGTFGCQFSKDFEKNLPGVKIIPEAVGSLLLNVLGNAFQSVDEKLKKGIKGYVPKVSISTRILPRFVQIRIKDNSDGIQDGMLEQVYEPFYSSRETGNGAGLGLHFSRKIILENNGEIKIESEAGNGTDVYIKFFLQS